MHDIKAPPPLTKRVWGKLFGDKGCISAKLFGDKGCISAKLFGELLAEHNVQLITPFKDSMRNQLIPLADKLLLHKRVIIETIIDQPKNISQIEHIRHRRPLNFLVNVVYGLNAYCHQLAKPSLNPEISRALLSV